MKSTIFTFLMSLFSGIVTIVAQNSPIDSISNFKPLHPHEYTNQFLGPAISALKLDLGYLSPDIDNRWALKQLENAEVLAIDIVYSDYPKYGGFERLTKNRIKEVGHFIPGSLTNSAIQWNLVAQTNCHDRPSAEKLFHGVYVYYRQKPTEASMIKEKELLKEYIEALRGEKSVELPFTSSFEIMLDSEDPYIEKGEVVPDFVDRSIYDEMTYETEEYTLGDSINIKVKRPIVPVASIPPVAMVPWAQDSVLLSVLRRNNWPDMMITMDVTGSMYPYTAQLFTWLALQKGQDVEQYVFYNDGDRTPDRKKVIGETGGIYATKSDIPQHIEGTVYNTMRKGGGGDCPENDLEAIIKGLSTCEACKNVVLVADNWSPIKDIKLLEQVKVPIKIVLCGAWAGVNVEYLNLARATGGSIHLMEHDLTELASMQEGNEITILNQSYKIVRGKFVRQG